MFDWYEFDILDGAKIGKQSIIAAGTVVPTGMVCQRVLLVLEFLVIKKATNFKKEKSIKDWS